MTELSLAHAIEKVTFRLGLRSAGYITLAELFVQFPLSFEVLDEHVTQIADGRTLLKDEAGEHCAIHFPEFSAIGEAISTNNDCPVCLGSAPSPVTIAGEEVPAPLICDSCYRSIGRLMLPEKSSTISDKIKSFFVEAEEDHVKTTIMEHEICYKALLIGGKQLTHTAIAAQTRYGMAEVKDRLQTMGARRYVKLGLTPTQDAVAYSFPDKLIYPKPYFTRFKETMDFLTGRVGRLPKSSHSSSRPKLEIGVKSRSASSPGVSFQRRLPASSNRRASSESASFKIRVKKKGENDAPEQSPSTPLRISIRASDRFKEPRVPRKPILSVSPASKPEPPSAPAPVDDEPPVTPSSEASPPAPPPEEPPSPEPMTPRRSYAVADPHPEENIFADSAEAALSPELAPSPSDEVGFVDSAEAFSSPVEAPEPAAIEEPEPAPLVEPAPESFDIEESPEQDNDPAQETTITVTLGAEKNEAAEAVADPEDYDEYEKDGGLQAGEFIGTPIE